MMELLQNLIDGLGRGSLHALLALGIAVIFGVMSPSWEPLARRRDRTAPRDAGRP